VLVSQSDVFFVELRRSRSRIRRLILLHVALDHGVEDMRHAMLTYWRVRLYIRRSLERFRRVRAVVFNLNIFLSKKL